jgi:methyl-accepting chemotaxis protein
MFKNIRFSVKIGGGFAILLVLLAVVAGIGYLALRQVQATVAGMTAAKDITIHILEARREEKNFIIRNDDSYVGKVADAVKALNASIATLSKSGLSAGQREQAQAIAKASKDYEASFAAYVTAYKTVNGSSANARAAGEKLIAAVAGASQQVTNGLLEVRLAAVYFMKDRTDDRWKEFQKAASGFSPVMAQWAGGRKVANGTQVLDTYKEYIATIQEQSALYKQESDQDAAMVVAGRAVIDNAAKVEAALDAACRQTVSFAVLLLLISTAAAVLIGVILAVSLTLGITRPVRKTVLFAGSLANCDFRTKLDIEQKDEMGLLASSLNNITERMRAMCTTITESAEQVSATSLQIASSAQSLANDSQSQASALEETSAAVQQLTASVQQVAEHAQAQADSGEQGSSAISQVRVSIEDISKSLSGIADLASKSVQKSVEGAEAVQKVVEAITQISSGSDRIAGIVNVISDIADQTNLLALNASIEAARAGEHGRGFAVVAEEVSKLADRSASSTKEIETLIHESVRSVTSGVQIAQGSQTAMGQIGEASQQVKNMIFDLSAAMEQQVGALKNLVSSIERISEMSQSISAATEEQSTNAKEVAKAVENVSDLTQNAASAAEQMSASTEQLSGMAKQLRVLISEFKTKNNGASEKAAASPGAPVEAAAPTKTPIPLMHVLPPGHGTEAAEQSTFSLVK